MQNKIKWKTYIGIILVTVATYFNISWVWGILFIFWLITDLIHGKTFFIEEVSKTTHPYTYWLVITVWFLLSVISFVPMKWYL